MRSPIRYQGAHVAVHEPLAGTTRKRLAARIDSANWGEADSNALRVTSMQSNRREEEGLLVPKASWSSNG